LKGVATSAPAVAATLAVIVIGAVVFVGSGVYNIGADDHHARIVLATIEQLRNRSVAVRAHAIEEHRSRCRTLCGAVRRLPPDAWGKSMDDGAIWDLVSFARQMPTMTPAAYRQLSKAHSG
jgi:hypothetical protein